MSELKPNKTTNPKVGRIVKIALGILGFLGIAMAILTVANVFEFGVSTKITVSLISAIIGLICLFIAFSNQIDKFFNILETKEIKLSKDEKKSGIGIELIFFLTIAVVLIVIAVLLAMGYLAVENPLPLIGKHTRTFILVSLIVLSLMCIVFAFNEIIRQSVKEMKKVHWPTNKEMASYCTQVFAFVIFFSLVFLAFDYLVALGLEGLTRLLS